MSIKTLSLIINKRYSKILFTSYCIITIKHKSIGIISRKNFGRILLEMGDLIRTHTNMRHPKQWDIPEFFFPTWRSKFPIDLMVKLSFASFLLPSPSLSPSFPPLSPPPSLILSLSPSPSLPLPLSPPPPSLSSFTFH